MSQKLKDWVRLDSANVAVTGSNIRRPKRPKSGRWLQIEGVDCCGPTLTYTPAASITTPTFVLSCDASPKLTIAFTGNTASVEETTDLLQSSLSFLGYFSTDGTVITFQVKSQVADAVCAGTLTFVVS